MNILEAILSYDTTIGLRGSLTTFKKYLKGVDVDYEIPRELIRYIYHVNYERYRMDKCWIELDSSFLRYLHVTTNYDFLIKLIVDKDQKCYLIPRRKYFELTDEGGIVKWEH